MPKPSEIGTQNGGSGGDRVVGSDNKGTGGDRVVGSNPK